MLRYGLLALVMAKDVGPCENFFCVTPSDLLLKATQTNISVPMLVQPLIRALEMDTRFLFSKDRTTAYLLG